MKIKKINLTVLAFALLFSLQIHSAHAAAKAIFPDPIRAQPAQSNAEIDNSLGTSNLGVPASGIIEPSAPAPTVQPVSAPVKTHSNTLWWVLGIIAVLGGIVFAVVRDQKRMGGYSSDTDGN